MVGNAIPANQCGYLKKLGCFQTAEKIPLRAAGGRAVFWFRAMDEKRALLLDPHLAILCTPETLVYGASEALGLGAAIKVVAKGPEVTFLAPAPLWQKHPAS